MKKIKIINILYLILFFVVPIFINEKDVIENNKNVTEKKETINNTIEEVLLEPIEEIIDYSKSNVDEMGYVPIMMYHGIYNIEKNEYIDGNVDKNGYNRTKEAFIKDLEFYYSKNYRMIRLVDYINGDINTKLGFSPIVITFDDGNENNIKILGRDGNNNLIIDPNSAIGILESFKKKYPDYNVTATFFLNKQLFGQPEYNFDIINWLINNGYDIGNHTYYHSNFDKISTNDTIKTIGLMYKKLEEIVPNKYVRIVSLPYGSPNKRSSKHFEYIIEGEYDNYKYNTIGALRVGWEPNVSPYSKDFDSMFIKRVRAYDNKGKDFDIEMVFNNLEKNRYISDGDSNTIVVKDISNIKENINKELIEY